MKQALRTALFAATALTALAFTSSALASYAPKLVVSSSNAGQGTRIGVVVGANDDPTAVTTIYVPTAYQIATPSAGTKLGDVTATAAALDLGGVVLPLTGELDAIAPTATTGAEAQACGVTPTQTWDLHLSAAGNTLDIPVFIVTSPQPVAAAGYANEIVVCLPPPDVPVGTPGRSFDGAKLLSATFETSAIGEPAATGDYRWTSTWTPYTPGTGQPNTAGSVETQSIRHHPTSMVFDYIRHKVTTAKTKIVKVKGKRKKITTKVITTKVTYTAKSAENGKAPVDVVYAVDVNGKTKNGASGSFTLAHGKSAKVAVVALVDADSGAVPTGVQADVTDLLYHDLGATSCTPTPLFQGLPCIDATLGGTVLIAAGTIKAF